MSTHTPYDKISKYCEDKNLSNLKKGYILQKYYEEFYKLSKDCKTADEILGTEKTLLSDTTLSSYLIYANNEINNEIDDQVKVYKKERSFKDFGRDILIGVLASAAYTILLILIIILAQNQLKSFVSDLYDGNTRIQNTVNADEVK